MNTDQQYYQPKIEELFYGYECEVQQPEDSFMDWRWIRMEAVPSRDMLSDFRTPYLSKEQIEDEGWKLVKVDKGYTTNQESVGNSYRFSMPMPESSAARYFYCPYNKWELFWVPDNRVVRIHGILTYQNIHNPEPFEVLFNGHVPSINELRKLSQWLGIKKEETVKA